jgi:outer membrane protein insertion porin family
MGLNGEAVNIKDRINLGNNNGLRGFDYSGVGPKFSYTPIGSSDTNFIYGGKNLILGNVEYRFPNFLPQEFGFTTFLFFDVGTVFSSEGIKNTSSFTGNYAILDSKSIRYSLGLGLSWRSPIGMITISYAEPLRYQEFDVRKRFYLNIGGMVF